MIFQPVYNADAALVPCGRLPGPGVPAEETRICTVCDTLVLMSRVINFVLFTLVPAIAVLFYLIAGFLILLGGANPGWVATGKTIFKNTTWGLIIVFGAWMVTNSVLKSIAGNSLFTRDWNKVVCTESGSQSPPSTQRYSCNSQNVCVANVTGQYTESTCGGNCRLVTRDGGSGLPAGCFDTDGDGAVFNGSPDCGDQQNKCCSLCGSLPPECSQQGAILAITTTALFDGIAGVTYAQPVNASGGISPYTYSITTGSLPTGLNLSTGGVITGTPTTAGTYTFTVQAQDSTSPTKQSATKQLSIKVVSASAAVIISNVAVSNISTNSATITWTTDKSSTSQVEYSTSSSFSPSTSTTINSTPKTSHSASLTGLTADTTYFYHAKSSVTGFTAVSSTNSFKTLTVVGATLSVTTTSLPDGVVGTAYSQTLNATGGVTPYAWARTVGNLPPGLTMSTGGVITGTPTTAGTYTFTVKVEDSSSPKQSATKQLSIKVNTATTVACIFQGVDYSTHNICSGLRRPGGCGTSACSRYLPSINRYSSGAATVNILKTFMVVESDCNPTRVSFDGSSFGLMQLQAGTARQFASRCGVAPGAITPGWLTDPANTDKSICIAAAFINSIARGSCGSQPGGIYAGYNAGPGWCGNSADCSGQQSCSSGPMKMWECPYDNPQHTVCNTGLYQTKQGASYVNYCLNNLGF